MAYEFRLPYIGEGAAEGEILKWMVKEGEQVKKDQPLAGAMTDKVNVQIPSPRTGTISKIFAKVGDVANVGQTIVVIPEDGEPVSVPTSTGAPPPAVRATFPTPVAAPSPQIPTGGLGNPCHPEACEGTRHRHCHGQWNRPSGKTHRRGCQNCLDKNRPSRAHKGDFPDLAPRGLGREDRGPRHHVHLPQFRPQGD